MLRKSDSDLTVLRREMVRLERKMKREAEAPPRKLNYVNDYKFTNMATAAFDGNGAALRSSSLVVTVLSGSVVDDSGVETGGGAGPTIDPVGGALSRDAPNPADPNDLATTDWTITRLASVSPIAFVQNASSLDIEVRYNPANDAYLYVFGG